MNNGEPWWISLIKAAIIVNLVMLAFAYTTWLERKLLGRMQLRYGPNRAGPFGLLQPIADLIKLIRKESFFPVAARDSLYIGAPVISMFTALLAFAVIPWGAGTAIETACGFGFEPHAAVISKSPLAVRAESHARVVIPGRSREDIRPDATKPTVTWNRVSC